MRWTHNICLACWIARKTNQIPAILKNPEMERCCFCGQENQNGIYVRHDPKELNCIHEED